MTASFMTPANSTGTPSRPACSTTVRKEELVAPSLIWSYLVHSGYAQSASAFIEEWQGGSDTLDPKAPSTKSKLLESHEWKSIECRQRLTQLIRDGHAEEALNYVHEFFPQILYQHFSSVNSDSSSPTAMEVDGNYSDTSADISVLHFRMLCQQFAELKAKGLNEEALDFFEARLAPESQRGEEIRLMLQEYSELIPYLTINNPSCRLLSQEYRNELADKLNAEILNASYSPFEKLIRHSLTVQSTLADHIVGPDNDPRTSKPPKHAAKEVKNVPCEHYTFDFEDFALSQGGSVDNEANGMVLTLLFSPSDRAVWNPEIWRDKSIEWVLELQPESNISEDAIPKWLSENFRLTKVELSKISWIPNAYHIKAKTTRGQLMLKVIKSSPAVVNVYPIHYVDLYSRIIDSPEELGDNAIEIAKIEDAEVDEFGTSRNIDGNKNFTVLPIDLTKVSEFPSDPRIDPKIAFGFKDPLFSRQWHLFNQYHPGYDINVTPVWLQGNFGNGTTVCIIDDGLDFNHPDLQRAFQPLLSFDFNERRPLPMPDIGLNDRHGTRCAGQIAAQPNDVCGVGVAFEAKVSALRILSKKITTIDEAAAVVYKYHDNHIYSCSWGPSDNGATVDGPDALVLKAFIDGILHGRNGLGSIYVFASGNGRRTDNCNYDGYANAVFSLTIGAIDHYDQMPYYMEECAAQLTVTYSSNINTKILTTDIGGKCTEKHGGTSAAAPLAAGILALVLTARPDLTWRDLQQLCILAAKPMTVDDRGWRKNGLGKMFSHKFGYGKIDTFALVEMAKTWKLVGPPILKCLPFKKVNAEIPYNALGIRSSVMVEESHVDGLDHLEHITVTVDIKHARRGDLQIYLESPMGTVSQLATRRIQDNSGDGLSGWTFMSVMFWGESALGAWTLLVVDNIHPETTGSLLQWRLSFWGETTTAWLNQHPMDYGQQYFWNYFPPTADYFDDRFGIWSNSSATSNSSPISHGYTTVPSSIQEDLVHNSNGYRVGDSPTTIAIRHRLSLITMLALMVILAFVYRIRKNLPSIYAILSGFCYRRQRRAGHLIPQSAPLL